MTPRITADAQVAIPQNSINDGAHPATGFSALVAGIRESCPVASGAGKVHGIAEQITGRLRELFDPTSG